MAKHQGTRRAEDGAAAAPSTGPSAWILDRWRDLLLFVGPPALLLPGALVAERMWSGKSLYALVMAFGALGHHLPGMMRAYGDRALFDRFKTRFIVAPIFLVLLCAGFALRDPALSPILLLTYFWGVWHGLMQTHGFLRIYDAKAGSFGKWTVRLDQWMCLSWFGAGVLFSTSRMHSVLQKFYASGGPAVPMDRVHFAQIGWGILTAIVTSAYLINLVVTTRTGHAPSRVKLLLLFTSIGFWWYCNAVVDNMLLGLALFEIFHDVQYLAIVWMFNRRRVQADRTIGRFTTFLFGNTAARAWLYVGLVFAYGSLSLLPKWPAATVNAVFTGILAASTLLHFYFDSFIWKVREKSTRKSLGLEGGAEIAVRGGIQWRQRVPQALRWSALVIPALCLAVAQTRPRLTQDEAMHQLGVAFPHYPLAQGNLAVYLLGSGDADAAMKISRSLLAQRLLDPDLEKKARSNLFWGLVAASVQRVQYGQAAAAQPLLLEAQRLDPNLGRLLSAQAAKMAADGDHARAITQYRTALLVSPGDAGLHLDLARELSARRFIDDAIAHARRARELRPSDPAPSQLLERLEAERAAGG